MNCEKTNSRRNRSKIDTQEGGALRDGKPWRSEAEGQPGPVQAPALDRLDTQSRRQPRYQKPRPRAADQHIDQSIGHAADAQ